MTGVDPSDAAVVLKRLLDTWDTAGARMLDAVARRLARGIDQPGWAERKAQETLALRDELAAIVTRLDAATATEAVAALEEAYGIGERAAQLTGRPVQSRPQVVQSMASRLVSQLAGASANAFASHLDLYRTAVRDAELDLTTGTIVRRDAVAKAVDHLLYQGVDRFTDRAGRSWHLDTYVRMAGRTLAGQTAVQGQLDTMTAGGRDLVIISDSPRECPQCRPWEGRILSVSGASLGTEVDGRKVTGTVAQARGGGLWHPNCTHRADPYTPGLTRKPPAKANPDGYKDQQKLRALERGARELKRRLAVAKQLGDPGQTRRLNAAIRDQGRRINTLTETTGQLRRRDRERPVPGSA